MKLISHAVFAIVGLVVQKQYYRALAQHSQHVSESEEDFDESGSNEHDTANSALLKRMLNHTFVALIDILFTDDSKRTCTGTIIHDNVVITAAHCFAKSDKYIQPELTASFVVIGSKKMFETGYEHYLPIERVINHPMYRGWTADIALVYTFVGMTSDKPGTVMSLAGEKMSTPNHSNVTVLSWGHCKDNGFEGDGAWKKRSRFQIKHTKTTVASMSSTEEVTPPKAKKLVNSKTQLRYQIKDKPITSKEKTKRVKPLKKERHKKRTKNIARVTKGINRAISSSEDETDEHSSSMEYDETINYNVPRAVSKDFYDSFFKNWRRSMGPENNKLIIETFGFFNVQTCKKLVQKAMPEKYEIKNANEYVCYSSDEHYVTDEDAGAPAVRHGHLVAVTLGGVDCDDEHVAVGIKVSCFCSWIADNLPNDGSHLKCCDHCCDEVKPSPPQEDVKEQSAKGRGKRKKTKF